MIWFSKECIFDGDEYLGDNAIFFGDEDKSRILQVLKRGINTLSPSDPEIVNLIQEMERE